MDRFLHRCGQALDRPGQGIPDGRPLLTGHANIFSLGNKTDRQDIHDIQDRIRILIGLLLALFLGVPGAGPGGRGGLAGFLILSRGKAFYCDRLDRTVLVRNGRTFGVDDSFGGSGEG